jgi:hypothetical protein
MRGRERASDRVIGIVLGIVLGVAIVIAFVFLGGGESIDAPSLDEQTGTRQQTPTQTAPLTPTNPAP